MTVPGVRLDFLSFGQLQPNWSVHSHASLKMCARRMFILEGGISGQNDKNKKYAEYIICYPKKSANSEHAHARTSPKTCARSLFFIEGGISW